MIYFSFIKNIVNDDNMKFLRMLEEKNSKIKYPFSNRTHLLANKINERFQRYRNETIDTRFYDKRLIE
jgi:ribosomal protein L35